MINGINLDNMDDQTRTLIEAYRANPPPALTPEGMRHNALSIALTNARSKHAFFGTSETRIAYESALVAAVLGGLDVEDEAI